MKLTSIAVLAASANAVSLHKKGQVAPSQLNPCHGSGLQARDGFDSAPHPSIPYPSNQYNCRNENIVDTSVYTNPVKTDISNPVSAGPPPAAAKVQLNEEVSKYVAPDHDYLEPCHPSGMQPRDNMNGVPQPSVRHPNSNYNCKDVPKVPAPPGTPKEAKPDADGGEPRGKEEELKKNPHALAQQGVAPAQLNPCHGSGLQARDGFDSAPHASIPYPQNQYNCRQDNIVDTSVHTHPVKTDISNPNSPPGPPPKALIQLSADPKKPKEVTPPKAPAAPAAPAAPREAIHDWTTKPYTNPTLLKPPVDLRSLEHCPDFNERHVLLNGVTRAIPYPQKGFNCNKDWAISQNSLLQIEESPTPLVYNNEAGKGLYNWGKYPYTDPGLMDPPADLSKLELCPNMIDRHVLLNGRTLAIVYPEKGYNCQNWGIYLQTGQQIRMHEPTPDDFEADKQRALSQAKEEAELEGDNKPSLAEGKPAEKPGAVEKAKVEATAAKDAAVKVEAKVKKAVEAKEAKEPKAEKKPKANEEAQAASGEQAVKEQKEETKGEKDSKKAVEKTKEAAGDAEAKAEEKKEDDPSPAKEGKCKKAVKPKAKEDPPCEEPVRAVNDTKKAEARKWDYGLHSWDHTPYIDPEVLKPPVILNSLETCPNMDTRKTLNDGVTIAVAYPDDGYNCQNYGIFAQIKSDIRGDGDEAAATKAKEVAKAAEKEEAKPQDPGKKAKDAKEPEADKAAAKAKAAAPKKEPLPTTETADKDAAKSGEDQIKVKAPVSSETSAPAKKHEEPLKATAGKKAGGGVAKTIKENKKDDDKKAKTDGEAAPAAEEEASAGKKNATKGSLHDWQFKPYTNPGHLKPTQDMKALPHCPDFDERHTLPDGVTRGIPYPQKGYNCNNWA